MKEKISTLCDGIESSAYMHKLSEVMMAIETITPIPDIVIFMRVPCDTIEVFCQDGFSEYAFNSAKSVLEKITHYTKLILEYWIKVSELTEKRYENFVCDNCIADLNIFEPSNDCRDISESIKQSDLEDKESKKLLRHFSRYHKVSNNVRILGSLLDAMAYQEITGQKIPFFLFCSVRWQISKMTKWEKPKWTKEMGLDLTKPPHGVFVFCGKEYEID